MGIIKTIKTAVFFAMILTSGASFASTGSLGDSGPIDGTEGGFGCSFFVCKPDTAPINEGND